MELGLDLINIVIWAAAGIGMFISYRRMMKREVRKSDVSFLWKMYLLLFICFMVRLVSDILQKVL